jgi:peptide/nickel transport system substrate-binding protein
MAYDPGTSPYAYNPDRARQLLAEAGYDRGLDLSFDIPTIYPDEAIPLAALLQTHWAQVGIRAQIRTHPDRPGYADMVRAKQIGDACLFDSSPLSSMRVLYEKIHSQRQGPWWQGYQNYAVDQLIDQASTTVDFSQRQGLYQQAYRQIHADAPWIFLYSPTLRYGLSRQLADWRPGADGIVRMT